MTKQLRRANLPLQSAFLLAFIMFPLSCELGLPCFQPPVSNRTLHMEITITVLIIFDPIFFVRVIRAVICPAAGCFSILANMRFGPGFLCWIGRWITYPLPPFVGIVA